MSSNSIINPKPCNYNCGTRIYWNNEENAYFEVLTKQKHNCPNRSKSSVVPSTNAYKSIYYNNKKSFSSTKEPKPKMSNSFELLQGSIIDIQKKYETLSDIVTEYNGKVHGSQSHIVTTNSISLIVYYEVPEGQRDEVKRRFENYILPINSR
jgi:hypothetical protein